MSEDDRVLSSARGRSRSKQRFRPHPNVSGEAFKVSVSKTANNKVFAEESKRIAFCPPELVEAYSHHKVAKRRNGTSPPLPDST